MGKSTRKKLFLGESKIWNFTTNTMQRAHLKWYTFEYFSHDDIVETYFGINSINQSKDLTGTAIPQKNLYMRYFDAISRSNASYDELFYSLHGVSEQASLNQDVNI